MHSYTHCQFAKAKTQVKTWQRVCLPNRTDKTIQRADKPRQKEGQLVTAPTKNWRFSG